MGLVRLPGLGPGWAGTKIAYLALMTTLFFFLSLFRRAEPGGLVLVVVATAMATRVREGEREAVRWGRWGQDQKGAPIIRTTEEVFYVFIPHRESILMSGRAG